MSGLHTFCKPCARLLQISSTLLPALGKRPCEGCGTVVGYDYLRGEHGIEWGGLLAPYMHVWAYEVWPITWGIAMQDNYGVHVHEWSPTYHNFQTGESREVCRCKARRTSLPSSLDTKDGTK